MKGAEYEKKAACVMAAVLCVSLGFSGCGILPFEQDIPFLNSKAGSTETEKGTVQTDGSQDADTEQNTDTTENEQQGTSLNEESRLKHRNLRWSRLHLWQHSTIMMEP